MQLRSTTVACPAHSRNRLAITKRPSVVACVRARAEAASGSGPSSTKTTTTSMASSQQIAHGPSPPAVLPATMLTGEHPLSVDENWRRLWHCFNGTEFRGWSGINAIYSPPESEKPMDAKPWLRCFKISPSGEGHQVNLKEGLGDLHRERADGLIEASWDFSKQEAGKGDGFLHPYSPRGESVRTIGLTERIHVFTPLSVKGWKGPQAFAEAQAQRRRQAAEGGNEPASPKGHEQGEKFSPGKYNTGVPTSSWWCETFFHGDAAKRAEEAAKAQAAAGKPQEAAGGGQAPAAGPCRLSMGCGYKPVEEGMALQARVNLWEPHLVHGIDPKGPVPVRGLIEGVVAAPPLPKDSPDDWLLPILQRAASAAAEEGAAGAMGTGGGVTVKATQIRHDPDHQLLLESCATGRVVEGRWHGASPAGAAAIVGGAGADEAAPGEVGAPDLGALWAGGPEAVLRIEVPTGYSLYTYPDRCYIILADYLTSAVQPAPNATPAAAGQESGQRESPLPQAPPPTARPWVYEAGVMGYGGAWARVRCFMREDGWVDRWQVLEYEV